MIESPEAVASTACELQATADIVTALQGVPMIWEVRCEAVDLMVVFWSLQTENKLSDAPADRKPGVHEEGNDDGCLRLPLHLACEWCTCVIMSQPTLSYVCAATMCEDHALIKCGRIPQ